MLSILAFIIGAILGFTVCYLTRKQIAKEFTSQKPEYSWSYSEPAEFLDGKSDEEKIKEALKQ